MGVPLDIIYSQNIVVNQTICILLDAGNQNISGSSVTLSIDKKSGDSKVNQFSKVYSVERGKNWLATSFKFAKEGIYEIYFSDNKQNRLAYTILSVGHYQIKTEVPAPTVKYQNPEIFFCENVQSNQPINLKQRISLRLNEGSIYIYLKDDQPLNTNQIRANFMRKTGNSSEYSEFIAIKKYQIERNWANVYFKFKFEKPGEYKISIYDEKEILIKTGYITVVN